MKKKKKKKKKKEKERKERTFGLPKFKFTGVLGLPQFDFTGVLGLLQSEFPGILVLLNLLKNKFIILVVNLKIVEKYETSYLSSTSSKISENST